MRRVKPKDCLRKSLGGNQELPARKFREEIKRAMTTGFDCQEVGVRWQDGKEGSRLGKNWGPQWREPVSTIPLKKGGQERRPRVREGEEGGHRVHKRILWPCGCCRKA